MALMPGGQGTPQAPLIYPDLPSWGITPGNSQQGNVFIATPPQAITTSQQEAFAMRSELHFLTLFNNLISTQEVTSWETTAQKDSDFWPPKSIIWQKSKA